MTKDTVIRFFKRLFKKKNKRATVEELMSRNDVIREIYAKNQEDNVVVIDKPKGKECPNCHLKNAELVTCKKCGKIGCTECFVYNPKDGSYYCEDCWSDV